MAIENEFDVRNLSDDDLLSNAIRFAFDKCPVSEDGSLTEFQKYKKTFLSCTKWLRDNYEPVIDDFLGETEIKV